MNTTTNFQVSKLSNGLTLVGERMGHVSSAAFSILIPAGAATDPDGCEGSAVVLSEMLNKGAGSWDSLALSHQFEAIGAQRNHTAGIEVSLFSGALLGENLGRALELYSTVLQKASLPVDELESVRQLALQDLRSLDDQPAGKVMVELARHLYTFPYNRSQYGTEAGLQAITPDSLKRFYAEQFVPSNVIVGLSGNFNWDEVVSTAEREFGSWEGTKPPHQLRPLSDKSSNHHVSQDTSQLQIALAYPSVSADHDDYYAARLAVAVLSGGMAGRLFVEVREKRGLVYRVSASHSAAKGRAAVFAYAGTSPENGQETLDVLLNELKRLKDGISKEELQRAKADVKSKVIMHGELSTVRASYIVNDWWHLERVRSLDEMEAAIDAVTEKDILDHLERYPVNPVTLVTLGPKGLSL